jgi:uncharacterized lipoprotein YbaY
MTYSSTITRLARPQLGRNRYFQTLQGSAFLILSFCWMGSLIAQDRWGSLDTRSRQGTLDRWQGNSWLGGQQTAEWNLGVRGDSTETGFLISQVTPGSAADRARLQAGDVIVTVEGFQVGQVAGRLFDLTQEINRRADTSGAVRLLMQDGQTGRLASVRVQLDGHTHLLTGTIIAPQILPPDAIVTVQVDNVTRPHMVVRNGQQVLSGANQRNIPFQISYDPAYVAAADVYQVRATVSSGGRDVLYTQPARVLTQGSPSNVQLRLEGLVATAGATSPGVAAGYVNYNEFDQRLVALYREYLGRDPTPVELAASRVLGTNINNTLDRLPLKLMASQEYFDLARNDNDFWLTNVFGVIIGRTPNRDEIVQWRQRFAELRYSRTELLRQLKQASL